MKSKVRNFFINLFVSLYFPIASRTFKNPIRYLEFSEIRKSAEFIANHLHTASLFDTKKGGIWEYVMGITKENSLRGMWLEFGVRDGYSARFFSKHALKLSSNQKLFGFDSFTGIRDNWSSIGEPVGSFSRFGIEPPKIDGCVFIKGWVEETLINFLESNEEPVAFVHFDLDVYAPTKYTLKMLKDRLQKGSIILFDEFHGYPGWELNEKRALEEVLDFSSYQYIAFSRKQAAIQII